MKLPTVAKMLVDKAIQEFQSNNINNAITYLQGAEQEERKENIMIECSVKYLI
jgi:hypothetical protein